uniref:Uncharacterized protein n=1 Tax=Corethron hystrix TaxID=216773 RepID=A0A7S1BJC4_9STRA|mmetsp:Transcript_30500/g.69826  ORF Transcript_30500/g.69826 Transcript_30500/m.69826 type:complete len:348 (+) Transcript_30500:129-1172(+)
MNQRSTWQKTQLICWIVRFMCNFFQACGPSFIRSMRRSCEFSTLFDLKTEEATDTATLDYIIQSAGSSISDSTVIAESTSSEDLTISMTAYGIDISSSNAFMARSFDAYGDVLDAAFKSCMDPNVGLVKSIEVVPWVNNVQFQNIAKLDRSLETGTAEQSRMLSPFLRRFNLITNAEHVGRLAEVLRHRMTTFGMVMKCLAAANAFPHLDNNRELLDKYHTCPLNRSTPCPAYTGQMTLFDLKEALRGIDSSGKYLIERMADNINDYIEHYMTPCLTDMTSEAFGVVGGNMQSQHWIRMDGCLEVSCVFVGVKWDPSTNKCVADAPEDNLDYTVDRFCAPKFSTGRP